MLFYHILSLYFFIMIITIVYWATNIKALNGSGYAQVTMLLSLAICFYVFGYTMEISSESLSQILFWNYFEYIGIPFVSALWITVALMYTGHFSRYKFFVFTGIYLIPLITIVLRFTNDYHNLYFASVAFTNKYGKVLLVRTFGPWMYVQLTHSIAMVLTALALFIQDYFKAKDKNKGKIILIMGSTFIAIFGLALSYIKPLGYMVDYMAVCLPLACIMIILAILHYNFLETKSLARSKAYESSRDAILLVNGQNKIIDYNKNAKRLFGYQNISLSEVNIDALFENNPYLQNSLKSVDVSIIMLPLHSTERYYEISTRNIDYKHLS